MLHVRAVQQEKAADDLCSERNKKRKLSLSVADTLIEEQIHQKTRSSYKLSNLVYPCLGLQLVAKG